MNGLKLDRRSMVAGACATAGMALGRVKLSSKKKGFCLVPKNDGEWAAKLKKLNAKWYYTWGAKEPNGSPATAEFVPMMWGKWGCNAELMAQIRAAGHKTLLGFNEPDQKKQANISVEKAIELWPLLMGTGARLGSPAGVHPDGEWMIAFMDEAQRRNYRVDFITMHSYMGANARHFLSKVEKIHKRYKKPIWITEFAVADWTANEGQPNKHSANAVMKFMEDALPKLEKMDYVERYSWFSAAPSSHVLGTSALFAKDGTLTPLGEWYASI
ncbi:glycoside hydrolase family protein [Pontiella sp.]|uniref:glycoside hydrolase family protein n=1 Tax=Pontiella sp. TaxID=2837462 RepID=UPI0035684562